MIIPGDERGDPSERSVCHEENNKNLERTPGSNLGTVRAVINTWHTNTGQQPGRISVLYFSLRTTPAFSAEAGKCKGM
jgi:hypothetical protein